MMKRKRSIMKSFTKKLNTKQKNDYQSKEAKQIVFSNKDHKPAEKSVARKPEPELKPEPEPEPEPELKPEPEPRPKKSTKKQYQNQHLQN